LLPALPAKRRAAEGFLSLSTTCGTCRPAQHVICQANDHARSMAGKDALRMPERNLQLINRTFTTMASPGQAIVKRCLNAKISWLIEH
jgi:hypothetical protein